MLRTLIGCLDREFVFSNISTSIYYQPRRWKRKPIWLGTAKSKLFRVPERKKLPEDETEELKRLHNNYRTYMKSIRHFLIEQAKATSSDNPDALTFNEEDEEEHKNRVRLNDEWNARVGKLREETLEKEKQAEFEEILKTIEQNKIEMQQRQREVDEIIKLEKEKAKFYITEENIDEAIDKALDNVVDYNYAIDLDEKYYIGRRAKASKVSKLQILEKNDSSPAASAATC